MSSQVTQLALPFSVLSENRKEPFSDEMEKAAVFCLAELERQKGKGLILKQPPEKTAFIARTSYPFLLVSWNELTLIFDGLNTTTHNLAYRTIPDAESFIQNLQNPSQTLETHMAFLSDNVNYFQAPTNERKSTLNGLLTEAAFLTEFSMHLQEARQPASASPDLVTLPVTLDETALSSMIQELENLRSNFQKDVKTLYASMKLLNKITNSFLKTLRTKTKAIEEEYGKEIKKQEAVTMPKTDRIRQEYDEKITGLSMTFEKQLLPLQKEKVKLEKTAEQTENKIEHYKIEAKTCSADKDLVGERKWKEKIDEAKKQLSELKKETKDAEARIKATEEKKTLEIFNLRSESEAKITEAKKDLLELEAACDSKVNVRKQEMEKMKTLTATIIEQISTTAKSREANTAMLNTLGIQQKRKENTLGNMPFYIVCYQSEKRKRYAIVPPSVANNVGFITKLKGALGQAKVKQVLSPRFKATAAFLNRLPLLIEQNAVLEREICEEGEKADILKLAAPQEQVRNGLQQLKDEGWFSEKEHEAFKQTLT